MKDEYKAVGSWSTLGLEIVLSLLLCFFLGCAAAVKAILRTLAEMKAVTAREEREHGNPAPRYERPRDRPQKEDDERRS